MQENDALLRLMDRCTARLAVNAGREIEVGTAFFVGSGYLLTCAHVVSAASSRTGNITVEWGGQKYRATLEQMTEKTYPDLALLKVSEIADHPCVYLFHHALRNDEFYAYG